MAIKLVSVKCPECNASLDIEGNRTQAYCMYCGTKLLISNENELVYKHIDEAAVRRAETDRLIRLKEIEIAEKRRESEERSKRQKMKVALLLLAIGIAMVVIGYILGDATGNSDSPFYMLSMVGLLIVIGVGNFWLISATRDKDNQS